MCPCNERRCTKGGCQVDPKPKSHPLHTSPFENGVRLSHWGEGVGFFSVARLLIRLQNVEIGHVFL